MSIDLEQVVLDGGSRFVNFFEGRILTGRDLRDEQTAARAGRDALGRAGGYGVVHGLEVTDATPSGAGAVPAVRVQAGLGVTRDGQTLDLGAARDVRLAELALGDPARSTGTFGLCDDQPDTSSAPTAEGFHILTLAPATGYEEEAPKSGLTDPGTAGGCGRRYVTLGLQFRLIRFDPALLAGGDIGADIAALSLQGDLSARARLRNLVAHLGLGTEARAGFPRDPFSGAAAADALSLEARLSRAEPPLLADCELPLAVLRLRGGRIDYVDPWSVRRGLRTDPVASDWPLIASGARAVRDASALFQFQDQLAGLFARLPNPATVAARTYFRYLPPAGFLPLASAQRFLPGAGDPLTLAPGRVIPLVEEALAYPAPDLSDEPGFTIYRVAGVEDWVLFVSDIVPSAEREARDRAALEDRVRALETAVDAPAVITGRVTRRFALATFASGNTLFSNPWAGVTVRAEGTARPTVDTVTDDNGDYRLDLIPGDYIVLVIDNGTVFNGTGVTAQVERGQTVTRNIEVQQTLQILDRN